MYTSPVAKSPVICTSRMKVLVMPCWVQVLPLSVDTRTCRAPPPTLKSFQETYMFPKCGEEGLLSDQPDSRSSPPLLCTQKCVQLFGSSGVVDLYPPNVQLPLPSSQTVNQVPVGLLYSITGSPKVLANGLLPLALVTRVKVMPPSVEHDMPEKLLLLAPRESLNATQTSSGLSGLGIVYVSDCVVLGNVSVPVTRLTSAAPYARGTGSSFWISRPKAVVAEGEPPCPSPQASMMSPHLRPSILSMPSS